MEATCCVGLVPCKFCSCPTCNGGKGGLDVYGSREKRGWEAAYPRGRKPGGISKKYAQNCTILCNRKSTQRLDPLWKGRELGVRGTGLSGSRTKISGLKGSINNISFGAPGFTVIKYSGLQLSTYPPPPPPPPGLGP